jgi:CheY-like chemotaxis protein
VESGTGVVAGDFRGADCALSNPGYDLILACDGEQAIRECRAHGDLIDLLLLDVVLPKIDGREAYARIIAERPDVAVIFAIGYRPISPSFTKSRN